MVQEKPNEMGKEKKRRTEDKKKKPEKTTVHAKVLLRLL